MARTTVLDQKHPKESVSSVINEDSLIELLRKHDLEGDSSFRSKLVDAHGKPMTYLQVAFQNGYIRATKWLMKSTYAHDLNLSNKPNIFDYATTLYQGPSKHKNAILRRALRYTAMRVANHLDDRFPAERLWLVQQFAVLVFRDFKQINLTTTQVCRLQASFLSRQLTAENKWLLCQLNLDFSDDPRVYPQGVKLQRALFQSEQSAIKSTLTHGPRKRLFEWLALLVEKSNSFLKLPQDQQARAAIEIQIVRASILMHLEKKRNITLKNPMGNTVLHKAVATGDTVIVNAMLKRADIRSIINKSNTMGDTALHFAAQRGNRLISRLLLKMGADYKLENRQRHTPIDILKRVMPPKKRQMPVLAPRNDASHHRRRHRAAAAVKIQRRKRVRTPDEVSPETERLPLQKAPS